MSQENVELWRASIEDLRSCNNEVDWEGWLSRVVERWDPDIEWDASGTPLSGERCGRQPHRVGVGCRCPVCLA
jgi:hypothetical protein